MKKITLFLLLAGIFASCEGPMGPMGETGLTGPQGEPGVATWHIETVTVEQDSWMLSGEVGGLNSFYFTDVEIPELTQYVFKYGTVLGYIYTEADVKNGLPYVLHKGASSEEGDKLWTQTYDFDFVPGGVRLYVTFSDFETGKTPGNETFGIVLMW